MSARPIQVERVEQQSDHTKLGGLPLSGRSCVYQLHAQTCALLAAFIALTNLAPRLRAAAPTLDHLFPVAVQLGKTTEVSAVGKFAPWPAKIWTDSPGITFRPEKTAGKFTVEVSSDAAVGPHFIRAYNETGASGPRFLIVTGNEEITETEPNDHFAKAPAIERLPTTINARLNKSGDVDSYAVTLDAGQTLVASLEAFVLASPVDAVLRLVDSRGLELALNHDSRTMDPFLAWTAKTAGTYVLQVFGFAHPATADVRFAGSDACVYRLHLSRGPQARYTLPLGLQRGAHTKVRAFGWNMGALSAREIEVEGPTSPAVSGETVWRLPEFENALTLPVTDGPELLERDFVARAAEMPPPIPFAVTGCIEKVGEEDVFRFSATKDEKILLEIQSASLGFPLDAWLAIWNSGGTELVRNDDGPNADPVLEWTAPETGTFVAVVGSVLHRCGADFLYRLSVQRPQPAFKAVVAESGFTIAPGKSTKIKVTATRTHGFNARLTASVTGLPGGVVANPVPMDSTEKEITLELSAGAEACPFSGPIRIQLRESESDIVHAAVHELTTTSRRNGVPQGFPDLILKSTDQFWFTILPAAQAKIADAK